MLNLTRNVRVEGTVSGKSHAFIRSTAAQTIAYTRVPVPRAAADPGPGWNDGARPVPRCTSITAWTAPAALRSQAVSRGDLGSHAYVPHMSDGITMLDCISHQSVSPAYWWDAFEVSNDITYDRCVAVARR